mgnify:CR=1 FL=1
MKGKSVSVVIANWNGKHLMEQFLPSVLNALRDCDEVIVVDNGSTDGSVEFLRENFPQVRLIRLPKNYGFSVANNIGVLAARNEVVVLLNNDMRPEEGFLEPLLSHFNDPTVFAVGAKLLHFDGSPDHANRTRLIVSGGFLSIAGERDSKQLNLITEPEEQAHAQGGGAAFDRKKFLELGGFDPIFSPAYFEDVDLSLRALQKGWRIVYEPRSIVWHLGGQTGKARARWFFELVSFRNFLIFNFLNAPTPWWLGWQMGSLTLWLMTEALCGDFLTYHLATLLTIPKWWGIVKRRWLNPLTSAEGLLKLLKPEHLGTSKQTAIPEPPPSHPFVLLIAPAYEGDKVVLKMAADAVRRKWRLPVALVIRPGQETFLSSYGIADKFITFLPGTISSQFHNFGQLVRWLLKSPCQALVIPAPSLSPSKGKFVAMGILVNLLGRKPLWEWRDGRWKQFSVWDILVRLPLLPITLGICFTLAIFLSLAILSSSLKKLCGRKVHRPKNFAAW